MSTVVVVPVLGRPEQIGPLAESVRSTSDARLVFVCSPKDTVAKRECKKTGEKVMVVRWEPGPADYSRKINHAYRHTTEEWIFCGATDLSFRPNWLTNALRVGERGGAGVIGTQDMGNPLVKRGRHATHPLVSRAYIEECGGTFDATGEIYSERYDHQYIDLELVETARLRGRWAFAKNSVVEHLHPNWNKGVWDDTYEKAFAHAREDRNLYVSRMKLCERHLARQHRRAAL